MALVDGQATVRTVALAAQAAAQVLEAQMALAELVATAVTVQSVAQVEQATHLLGQHQMVALAVSVAPAEMLVRRVQPVPG